MTGSRLFLTFGRVTRPEAALAEEGFAVAAAGRAIGVGVALVGDTTPALRLNTPGAMRVPPELAAVLDTRAGLRRLCEDRLMGGLAPFAADARRFVAAYLVAIARLAGPAPEGTPLFDPADRYFAALKPLGTATCLAVTGEGVPLPLPGAALAEADVALWDGKTLRLVLLGASQRLLPRKARALAALEAAEGERIKVMTLSGMSGEAAVEAVLADIGEAALFGRPPYWGPYRAEALTHRLPA